MPYWIIDQLLVTFSRVQVFSIVDSLGCLHLTMYCAYIHRDSNKIQKLEHFSSIVLVYEFFY